MHVYDLTTIAVTAEKELSSSKRFAKGIAAHIAELVKAALLLTSLNW